MVSIDIKHYSEIFDYSKVVERLAVRAIISKNDKLLMIKSEKNGDYKFPGGGVEHGESYEEALIREVREESGFKLERIEMAALRIIEESKDKELKNTMFRMTSIYYPCSASVENYGLKLDKYEEELGFTPVWIDMNEALKINEKIEESGKGIKWIKREIRVLKEIISKSFPLTISLT